MLSTEIRQRALDAGFSMVGICPAVPPRGISRLAEWLEAGYAGEMAYLADRREAYEHPRHVLWGVKSIVVLGMDYHSGERCPAGLGEGLVSRYAWGGVDYHDLIHGRLKALRGWISASYPDVRTRGVVDTAPLLERDLAELAGLGWQGKNTLLLNRERGSWFFLAALLIDIELEYDAPFGEDFCGTCTACLDACPTQAFPQPYVLDATRCISYLTIEHRSEIPHELRAGLGDWLFGCDICQDVCPWNHHPQKTHEAGLLPRPDQDPVDLLQLLEVDEEAFRTRYRHTPLWRAKRRGLLRNAAIVLGNQRCVAARARLEHLRGDADPVIRDACDWALEQIAANEQPTDDGESCE